MTKNKEEIKNILNNVDELDKKLYALEKLTIAIQDITQAIDYIKPTRYLYTNIETPLRELRDKEETGD